MKWMIVLYDVVHGSSRPPSCALLAIHVAENDIDTAQNRDHIADLVAAQQLWQNL